MQIRIWAFKHENIIQAGIACKKILCYMRDSACRWFIVKKAKIFWSYVKVGLSPSKKKNVICFIERSLKMMKNAFYFILKAVFVLKIVKFFVMTFWSSRENGFIRKLRLTARFMTWFTNNYNTHSAQYLTKQKQPDDEIWSVNRI